VKWEDSLKLFHIYLKKYDNKKLKVRTEVQEYLNKTLEEVFMDKLKDNSENTFL
jgi:NADPH-dependent 7-cyano-7-deazaguanine reductase QueF-like protein